MEAFQEYSVSSLKVSGRCLKSWVSFFGATIAIAAFGVASFALVAEFIPGSLRFFSIGVIIASILSLLLIVFNEKLVVASMSLRRIKERKDNPKLWDAVDRGRGSRKLPRVYIMWNQGENAFAFGLGRGAVAATSGIINRLDADELAAVMAHEVGHLKNRDILITMFITGTVIFFAVFGWLVKEFAMFASSDKKNDSFFWRYLLGIIIGGFIFYFARGLASLLRFFVSRQRELAADAISAGVMGTPEPLISALTKISENPKVGKGADAALIGFLCTTDPKPTVDEKLGELLRTHPTNTERFRALRELVKS